MRITRKLVISRLMYDDGKLYTIMKEEEGRNVGYFFC